VESRPQAAGDLGKRMREVFRDAESEGIARTVIIGSDSPDLPLRRVEQAFEALGRRALVLAPAMDGGYVLLGARATPRELLHDMPWGEATLLTRTAERIRRCGLESELLEPWYDVDRPEDLALLAVLLGQRARAGVELAPRSRRLLLELGYTTAAA
jgi:rSAM/selenodomain-associated transferase 1